MRLETPATTTRLEIVSIFADGGFREIWKNPNTLDSRFQRCAVLPPNTNTLLLMKWLTAHIHRPVCITDLNLGVMREYARYRCHENGKDSPSQLHADMITFNGTAGQYYKRK